MTSVSDEFVLQWMEAAIWRRQHIGTKHLQAPGPSHEQLLRLFHSAAAAEAAEADFKNRAAGGVPDEIPELTLSGAPLGIGALLKAAQLAPSTTEALRLVDQGGVRVDAQAVSDRGLKLPAGTYVVQVGKRKFARVHLS